MCPASYKENHEAVSVGYSHLMFMLFYSPWNVLVFKLEKKKTNNNTKNNQTPSRGLGRVISKKMWAGSQKLWEAETHFTWDSGLLPHSWSNVPPQMRILAFAYLNCFPCWLGTWVTWSNILILLTVCSHCV